MEYSFRVWLRQQIFIRFLLKLKNSINKKTLNDDLFYRTIFLDYYFKKNRFFTKFFKKNIIKNIPNTVFQIFNIVFLYLNILLRKDCEKVFAQRFFVFKNNLISERHINDNNLIKFGKIEKLNNIGKIIETKGVICHIGDYFNNLAGILFECGYCKNFFYFIFETFAIGKPVLCANINCSSKKFLFHETRTIPISGRRIKVIRKDIFNNFLNPIINIEIAKYNRFNFKIGDSVSIKGILKINDNSLDPNKIDKKRNTYNFFISSLSTSFSLKKFSFEKKSYRITPKEYFYINKLFLNKDLFENLINTIGFVQGTYAFKSVLLLFNDKNCFRSSENKVWSCFLIHERQENINENYEKIFKYFPNCYKLNLNKKTLEKRKSFSDKIKNDYEYLDKNTILIENVENFTSKLNLFNEIFGKKQNKFPKSTLFLLKIDAEKTTNYKNRNQYNIPYNFSYFDLKPDLVFMLKKKNDNGFKNKNDFKFIDKFQCKGKTSIFYKKKKNINKNKIKSKNKFSKKFFIKYLLFIEHFPPPKIKESIYSMIFKVYDNFRNFNHCNRKFISIDNFNLIIKLSQSRAKLELRGFIEEDDFIDCLEIFFDCNNFYRKKTYLKSDKYFQIQKIYYYMLYLKKTLIRKNQSIFDIKIVLNNLKKKYGEKNGVAFIDKLRKLGLIEKFGHRFVRFKKFT